MLLPQRSQCRHLDEEPNDCSDVKKGYNFSDTGKVRALNLTAQSQAVVRAGGLLKALFTLQQNADGMLLAPS